MADFNIRSDQIDVEQIMRQIRARINEKRGVDYTEQEMRELASVKLERFLDPRALRSDLLAHYGRQRPSEPLPTPPPLPPLDNYAFDADTIYQSHRGPLRWIRKLLNPLLKLLFNPNPLIHVLHLQGRMNQQLVEQLDRLHRGFGPIRDRFTVRDELDALNYEVLNNLVLELTRLGIEVRNLKMRVESLSTRLDFDERRARSLEGLVQAGPGAAVAPDVLAQDQEGPETEGEGDAGRLGKRRRRRRGRRRGPGDGPAAAAEQGSTAAPAPASRPGDRPRDPEPRQAPAADDPGTDQ